MTGKKLITELSSVPFGNVVTAFWVIPTSSIIEMVQLINLQTLMMGLTVITGKIMELLTTEIVMTDIDKHTFVSPHIVIRIIFTIG